MPKNRMVQPLDIHYGIPSWTFCFSIFHFWLACTAPQTDSLYMEYCDRLKLARLVCSGSRKLARQLSLRYSWVDRQQTAHNSKLEKLEPCIRQACTVDRCRFLVILIVTDEHWYCFIFQWCVRVCSSATDNDNKRSQHTHGFLKTVITLLRLRKQFPITHPRPNNKFINLPSSWVSSGKFKWENIRFSCAQRVAQLTASNRKLFCQSWIFPLAQIFSWNYFQINVYFVINFT